MDALLGTAAGAQVVMKKLASKIAVGVKEDLTLTNSYQPGGSRKDFDECLAYRHEDFLNERREKGGDMLQVRNVLLSPHPLRPSCFLSLSSVTFSLPT